MTKQDLSSRPILKLCPELLATFPLQRIHWSGFFGSTDHCIPSRPTGKSIWHLWPGSCVVKVKKISFGKMEYLRALFLSHCFSLLRFHFLAKLCAVMELISFFARQMCFYYDHYYIPLVYCYYLISSFILHWNKIWMNMEF